MDTHQEDPRIDPLGPDPKAPVWDRFLSMGFRLLFRGVRAVCVLLVSVTTVITVISTVEEWKGYEFRRLVVPRTGCNKQLNWVSQN